MTPAQELQFLMKSEEPWISEGIREDYLDLLRIAVDMELRCDLCIIYAPPEIRHQMMEWFDLIASAYSYAAAYIFWYGRIE